MAVLFADDAVVFDPVGLSSHDPRSGVSPARSESRNSGFMIGIGDLTIVSHRRIPCGEYVCACDITKTNRMGDLEDLYRNDRHLRGQRRGQTDQPKAYRDTDKVRRG